MFFEVQEAEGRRDLIATVPLARREILGESLKLWGDRIHQKPWAFSWFRPAFLNLSTIAMHSGEFLVGEEGGRPVRCRTFNSIPGFYPLDASSTSPQVSTTTVVSRHCHVSPRDKIDSVSSSLSWNNNLIYFTDSEMWEGNEIKPCLAHVSLNKGMLSSLTSGEDFGVARLSRWSQVL